MYVCICHAVTDKQIRAAAENGASSVADLSATLGVAAGCGCCADLAAAVLADAKTSKSPLWHKAATLGHKPDNWYSVA